MPYADYTPVKELTGGRNKVMLARRGNALFALKFVNLTNLSPSSVSAAVDELKLLKALSHPHIVRLRECEIIRKSTVECMMIVTDYAHGGSLEGRVQAMLDAPSISIDSLQSVARWLTQTTAALKYCHEKSVIHRDLKLDNVLLTASGDALLADFGFARELSASGHASTVLGTPMNMAPELWTPGAVYAHGTDLWALGCLLVELVSLQHPFARAQDPATLRSLITRPAPTLAERLAVSEIKLEGAVSYDALELAWDMMQVGTLLLSQDANDRPSCAQVLASKAFSDVQI